MDYKHNVRICNSKKITSFGFDKKKIVNFSYVSRTLYIGCFFLNVINDFTFS